MKIKIIVCLILSYLTIAWSSLVYSQPRATFTDPEVKLNLDTNNYFFKNMAEIKTALGFVSAYQQIAKNNPNKKIKVAILDKGFEGFANEVGKSLPQNTLYIAGPISNPSENPSNNHGLRMAQIFTSLATNDLQYENIISQLYLYNVFGFTNFKSAIEDLIQQKVDLVLYSEVWEYGGNFDGNGFINNEVNKAIKNKIFWINAAGNFNQNTFNSSIKTGSENWVTLPDQNSALKIVCREQKCPVKIVLSWNDFKNDTESGTPKDLDFVLTDDFLNIIQSSSLKQSEDPNENRPGYSKYPREIITNELNSGTYFIRVKNRSLNFNSNQDQLRITIDGLNVEIPSRSSKETLLNPADNPGVITVGAFDSDRSSLSQNLQKPDLWTTSSLILNNGTEMRGSSNAAAFVAAGVALRLLDFNSTQAFENDRNRMINSIVFSNANWNQGFGLSLYQLGFGPTGVNSNGQSCFKVSSPSVDSQAPPQIQKVLKLGGRLVETTVGYRIITPYDPIVLSNQLYRYQLNDVVATTPYGYQIFNRYNYIPTDAIEVFQRPMEASLCETPSNPTTPPSFLNSFKIFRL